jgi:branched-subunit amino acid transport protein
MTWTFLLLMCAAAYLQKAVAPILLGAWEPPDRVRVLLHLLAVPVLAGLIVVQTFGDGRQLVLDARAAAVAAAVVAVWLRAPFLVVVLLAAGIRAIG